MWFKRFTKSLLQYRALAFALAFVSTFIPVLGIAGILIATLVTLRKSVVEGALLTIVTTVPYFISFYLAGSHEATIPLVMWAAVGVAVISNLLTWIFAVMLKRQTPWSQILQIAALMGVLVVSVVHLAYPTVADWWGKQLQSYYSQAVSMKNALNPLSAETAAKQAENINLSKLYATGLMTAAILFNGILQLIVARWWQALIYHPGLLRKELQGIRLSQLAGLLFIISLVLSYFGNEVILDIMPILYMLFGGAGLSVIHYLFGLMKPGMAWFWLSVLYLTLIVALPTSMVFVAILALFDTRFDMRKRIRKI